MLKENEIKNRNTKVIITILTKQTSLDKGIKQDKLLMKRKYCDARGVLVLGVSDLRSRGS